MVTNADFSPINLAILIRPVDGAVISRARAGAAEAIGYLLSLYNGRREIPPAVADLLPALDWLVYSAGAGDAPGALYIGHSVSGREIQGAGYQFGDSALDAKLSDTLAALRDPARARERRAIWQRYLRLSENVYR